MIDLHCHLAYGVDDGPKTPEESKALGQALGDAGVTHVACTSHLRRGKFWINDQSTQTQMHANLNAVLGDLGPKRFYGAEHYLDELLLATCQKGEAVPYSAKGWILLELPYEVEPPNLMATLFRIRSLGYKLLLAHLERFPYIYQFPEKVEALIVSGYQIQVNLGSLAGAYGREYQIAAEQLLKNEQVDILAGDCHQASDVKHFIIDGIRAAKRLVDDATFSRLTFKNPAAILGI